MTKFMRANKAIDCNLPNTNDPSNDLLEYIKNPKFGMDLKCDGTRAVFEYDEYGNPTIYGRGTVQHELHSQDRIQRVYNEQFPELTKQIPELALSTIDTEITITNPTTGNEDYNLLQTRANRKSDISQYSKLYPAKASVFDIQKYDGQDLMNKPLSDRREVMIEVFSKDIDNDYRFNLLPLGTDEFTKDMIVKHALKNGYEGVMIKSMDSLYTDRSSEWIKAKRIHTEDMFVLGMSEGRGKFKPYFGQLHCYQFDDHGNINFVCSVGGGFTFGEMDIIKNFFGNCFDRPGNSQREMKGMFNLLKNSNKLMVIEVKHYGVVKTGRRHPVFMRIRNDKSAEECIGRDSAGNDQMSLEEFV